MLNSLQVLRGLAAWAVVFHHIFKSYFMDDPKNSFVFMNVFKYGSLGVDIFFVLSGVVMALVANRYVNSGVAFGINRVFRVVPVYWFYTLLLVVSILIFPSGTYMTWWEGDSLLKSILFIPNINPNGYGVYPTLYVGWTLIYEMFFYLLFALILILRIPYPTVSCAFILAIIAVLTVNNNFLGQSSLLLIEFSIGIVIAIYYKSNAFRSRAALTLIFISLLTLALLLYLSDLGIFSRMVIAGSIVWLFVSLEKYFPLQNRIVFFLKTLGDWSYSTYLSHIIVIGWFYHFFANKGSAMSDWIAFLGILASVCFISFLSYRYIESNSYIERSKSRLMPMPTKSSSES